MLQSFSVVAVVEQPTDRTEATPIIHINVTKEGRVALYGKLRVVGVRSSAELPVLHILTNLAFSSSFDRNSLIGDRCQLCSPFDTLVLS